MRRFSFLFLIAILSSCQPAEEPTSVEPSEESSAAASSDAMRAQDGETVVMFFTHVQGEKRQEFEGFLSFFDDTLRTIVAEDAEFAHNQSAFRALFPSEANEDGTLTYVFMGDPLREGAETSISTILARVYSEDEIPELRKPWDDAMARPQDSYGFVQAKNMNQGPGSKAVEGETVVMFFTYVRADKQQEFETFVDFLIDTLARISAEDEEFARGGSFRALYPSDPDEDGTLTYVFMGDPLLEGTETDISAILSRVYSEEEVAEHMKPWDDAMARPQDGYQFVQSKLLSTQ